MENPITTAIQNEDHKPDLTPPVENPENALFQEWKTAPEDKKASVEHRLLQHLRRHAAKICWMVLHTHNPHLVDEISTDALMDLGSFKELSAFSTWFHSRATFRCRSEFRRQLRRREVNLEVPDGHSSAAYLETKVIAQQLLEQLPDFERKLVELKVFEGLTDAEIAVELGYTREWIQKSWSKLRIKLKEKYNGRSKVR